MKTNAQYAKGYQAALADITAVMESGGIDDDDVSRTSIIYAVEEWIRNNTAKPKPVPAHRVRNVNGGSRYRGYFFSKSPDAEYSIWFGDKVHPDNYIEDAWDVAEAKSKIDSYLEGK